MSSYFSSKFIFIFLICLTIFIFLIIYDALSNSEKKESYLIIKTIFNNNSFDSNKTIIEEEITNVDLAIRKINENPNYNIIDFEGFDNQNGVDNFIIPNIVHLIYLKTTTLKFYQAINIYSIYLNQNPDVIYIHCDDCDFKGSYWQQINSIKSLKDKIKINKIPYHDTIFGVKYGWVNHHRSDVWRLMVLMNYGGIFLDNDVYVVKSLDEYRKYEITVSWDSDKDGLGVQVIIANRNARLLKAHFDMYRTNYTPSEWYYNAGFVPANILLKNRNLAHVVKIKLGTHMLVHNLYKSYWPGWRELNTIHLLINHRSYLDKDSPIKEFDESNIQNYNYTYGVMCREVLIKIKNLLSS